MQPSDILNLANDAILLLDLDGAIVLWNRGAERLYGFAAPEALGKRARELLRTRFPLPLEEVLGATRIRGEWRGELVQTTRHGEQVTVESRWAPRFDSFGQLAGTIEINRDMTEHRLLEEVLRRSEERYRSLVEHSPIAIYVNRDDRVEYANPAACVLFGAGSVEELLGKWIFELSDPQYHEHIRGRISLLHHGEAVPLSEEKIVRLDGSVRDVEVVATPFIDQAGLAIQVMLRDITDRKRAEEALIRSEKLATVGRMAASIAHEINNPLAAVMNALYLARAMPNLPAGAQEYLETADEELKRIAMVTRQALGFYRESAARAPVSLGIVLDSVIHLLAGKIKSKNVTVLRDYDHSLQITAVAGELRQVFSNVVANSLDAVTVGGQILLRVSSRRNGDAAQVRVSIADDGQGIDPSSLPQVFEPFFTTKQTVGTGLGLWIGKQIVEKHQGRIQIRSRTHGPRRGTVVSVVLPMVENRAEAASGAAGSS